MLPVPCYCVRYLNPPAVASVAGAKEAVFVSTYDGVLYEYAA